MTGISELLIIPVIAALIAVAGVKGGPVLLLAGLLVWWLSWPTDGTSISSEGGSEK